MKNKIWVNISSVIAWHPRVVGITRTEKELARFFLADKSLNVGFCYWFNGKLVDITPVIKDLQKRYHDPIDKLANEIHSRLAFGSKYKNNKKIPIFLQPKLHKFWNSVSKYKLEHYLERKGARSYVPSEELPFDSGEVFFTCGLDWEFPIADFFYKLKKKGVKIVSFCYDMIPILYPQCCLPHVTRRFPNYIMNISESSELILCDSVSAQRDLHNYLNEIGGAQVDSVVVQLGDSCSAVDVKHNGNKFSKNSQYILFVSTIERRKNHETLYKVCHNLVSKFGKDAVPDFVFVGKKGWGVDAILNDIKLDPLTGDKIKVLTNVSDPELVNLYKNSLFCLCPSLYEGWGLPVREALRMGKFVLCSNQGALLESGGEYCEYLPPWDIAQWEDRIMFYARNREALLLKEKFIHSNYSPYGWENTFECVKALLKQRIAE